MRHNSGSKSTIPASFTLKKAQILSLLTQPDEEYTDKSPKGTVDEQIRELIDEINAYDGLVTTSSCAGRVAVFVEGPKARVLGDQSRNGDAEDEARRQRDDATVPAPLTSAGGKGGGRWLYVSHDPIAIPVLEGSKGVDVETIEKNQHDREPFSRLFNLVDATEPKDTSPSSPSSTEIPTTQTSSRPPPSSQPPRLVHLSFSPLILHIHCATLRHARPVLAAAINAGFRESGVPSLRALDDEISNSNSNGSNNTGEHHGVMVAVRTAGLAFETVVGVVDDGGDGEVTTKRLVGEEYLAMCAGVVNERFRWNAERRERFRAELRRAMMREGFTGLEREQDGSGTQGRSGWEDKDERRRRKREEGLERQRRERMGGIGMGLGMGGEDAEEGLDNDNDNEIDNDGFMTLGIN